MKVEVDVEGSPSLMVSVYVNKVNLNSKALGW